MGCGTAVPVAAAADEIYYGNSFQKHSWFNCTHIPLWNF